MMIIYTSITPVFKLGALIVVFIKFQWTEEELGSSEESGKDWSDLEKEAAEADKERSDFKDEYTERKKSKSHSHSRFNNKSSKR